MDFPIFPDISAHAVIAGLKCAPDILPPRELAIATAAKTRRGVPVKDTAPIKRLVPKNSTKAGVYISIDYTTEMKYLIVKGWCGFGDRLETLKMAVEYAIKNKLQIYVDWRDIQWSHGDESFYTYFKLINMPVLNSIDDIPEDASVFPPFWKGKLNDSITQDIIDKQKENSINIGILNTSYDGDVIVVSSIGNRRIYDDQLFFTNVFRVINKRIINSVRYRLVKYNLKNCIGIHIRGTDRVRNQTRRELSIQHMAINAIHFGGQPMVSVSDDKSSTEIWKRFYPQTVSLSELSMQESSGKGNHLTSKENLSISKDSLNIDMLTDFFSLSYCTRILTTYKDSRFAAEARRLHNYVDVILS